MAGDSLGTMTVGVTANVSEAERALNSLANMLERFERQQQTRQRSASSRPSASVSALTGFGPYTEAQIEVETRRRAQVQERALSSWMFKEIRRSELAAVSGRGTEENMRSLGEAFKSGDIERLEGVLGRANRGIQQVGDSSARTRYAVLNLGYGVQDAVQVFGTSGLAGAVRASANNLQGLGVIFEKTAGGMQGLKSALLSGEFIVMGVATAVLLAANAWEKYSKAQEEALAKESAEKFRRLKPEQAVEQAGREEMLNRELARMEKLNEAEAKRKQAVDAVAAANAKLNAAGREEADLKGKIAKIQKDIVENDRILQTRAVRPRVAGRDASVPEATPEEKALVRRVEEAGGRAKLVADLAELRKKMDEFATGGGSPEAMLKEKEAAQKELDAATKRATELQPDAVQNAKRELDLLQQQVKALDNREKLERDAIKDAQQRFNVIKQEDQLEENARVKREKYMEEMRKATTRGEQRKIKKDPQFAITEDELRAQEGSFRRSREREAVEKKIAAFDASAEKIAAERAAAQKKIASIEQTYPQFAPKEQLLEMQESDMEYRLRFLGKRRREVEQRMRLGNQPTAVAAFESSTAYEALARSRMGPAPETDTLKRILAAEEKATAALESIREKLDPGRGARIAILETFE